MADSVHPRPPRAPRRRHHFVRWFAWSYSWGVHIAVVAVLLYHFAPRAGHGLD